MDEKIDSYIQEVLNELFSCSERNKGLYTIYSKGDELLDPRISLTVDTQIEPNTLSIYSIMARALSELRIKEIRAICDEEGLIRSDVGFFQVEDDSLVWGAQFDIEQISLIDNPKEALEEFFIDISGKVNKQYNWARGLLLKDDYAYLMKEFQSSRHGDFYSFEHLGDGMLFCQKCKSHAVYLINTKKEKAFELVDDYGNMVGFSANDVDPSVIERDTDSENASNLKAYYRFWIYDFNGGVANIEWTVMPDGRYFADEDGFGAENYKELVVKSQIDTDGKLLEPFK